MPNLSLDDDLRRDYQAGFELAQNSAVSDEIARMKAALRPPQAQNGPAPGQAAAPAGQSAAAATPDPGTPQAAPASNAGRGEQPGFPALDQQRQQQAADQGGADTTLGDIVRDLGKGAVESLPQLLGGVVDAANQAADAIDSLEKTVGLDKIDPTVGMERATVGAPESVTGGVIRSTSQFLTGFIPAMKAVKGISLGSKALQGVEAGALASAVVLDPHEGRLSTYLNTVPALAPLVPDYLADNDPEHESEWHGRLKNAIEGAGAGVFTEGLVSLFKYYKAERGATAEARRLAMTPSELGAIAAKDAEKQAAVADLVNPIPPEALAGLGDPLGPMVTFETTPFELPTPTTGDVAAQRIDEAFARGETVDPIALRARMRERRQASAAGDPSGLQFLDGNKAVLLWQDTQHAEDILGARAAELAGFDSIESPNRGGMKIWFKPGHEEDARRLVNDLPKEEADAILSKTTDGEPVTFEEKPQPEPKVFINHARINAPEDVRALIQTMADSDAEAIAVKTRGVVSNAQTVKEAAKEFQNLEDLIGRRPGPMSASEAVAARKVLISSGTQLLALASKAAADGATPADLFAFRRAAQVHYAIQSEVVAARTETARALQSWAIPAGNDKMRADQIAELLGQGGGKDTVTMAKMLGTLADNPTGLNVFVGKSLRGKVKDALFEAWINGLLTSPKTHVVNVTSNALTTFWQIPERMLAAGISNAFYGGEIGYGEAAASAYGMAKGVRDGFVLASRGSDPTVAQLFEAFSKQERPYGVAISAEAFDVQRNTPLGFGLDYIGKAIRVPGAALDFEDKFFKAVNYRAELHALAYRQASQEGLEGSQLAQRMADLIADPPDNVKLEAIDRAHINTFTNKLGERGQNFTRFINSVPGGRLVVPFIRTPTNILKFTFARTPLAYASQAIRADIAAGGARAAQAHARVAMGSMVMLTIADMTAEGTISGAGPMGGEDAKTQRANMMRTGWKPYSVKIGDRYFTYNRLEPIGMLFGMSSDIAEVMGHLDDEEASKVVAAGAVAFAQNMASKTWAQGVFDALAAVDPNNPTSDPGKWLQDEAATTIPFSSFLRNLNQAIDPVLREPRTTGEDPLAQEYLGDLPKPVAEYMTVMLNQYRKTIPGLSDDLPARRDLWGRPISTATGVGWVYDFLSPVGGSLKTDDKVDQMIVDNRIKLSMPERSVRGVPLTGQEYQSYVALAGGPAKQYLDKLVGSPGFKKLSGGPDGMAATLVKEVVSKYRQNAANQMFIRFPQIRARWLANEQRKRQQLIGAQ